MMTMPLARALQFWRLEQQMQAAQRAGQYVTLEQLAQQSQAVLAGYDSLTDLVAIRSRLATALRMQGRRREAAAVQIWLIEQARQPLTSKQLTLDNAHGRSVSAMARRNAYWHIANAYVFFIETGQNLPQMSLAQLYNVIDDGLEWLQSVGLAEWGFAMRAQRALLLIRQGDLAAARLELEYAVAAARRAVEPPGYSLADYQMRLADILIEDDIAAYAEAIALAEEVLATTNNNVWSQFRALSILAYAYADLGQHDRALAAGKERLALAQAMQSSSAFINAYSTLSYVHEKAAQVTEAVVALLQQLRWLRRAGPDISEYGAIHRCCEIRLLQAKIALDLPLKTEDFPEQLGPAADINAAQRYLASARRFIARNLPLAARWDESAGAHNERDRMAKLSKQADRIDELIKD